MFEQGVIQEDLKPSILEQKLKNIPYHLVQQNSLPFSLSTTKRHFPFVLVIFNVTMEEKWFKTEMEKSITIPSHTYLWTGQVQN